MKPPRVSFVRSINETLLPRVRWVYNHGLVSRFVFEVDRSFVMGTPKRTKVLEKQRMRRFYVRTLHSKGLSLSEISKKVLNLDTGKYGITKQRVWQLLQRGNYGNT